MSNKITVNKNTLKGWQQDIFSLIAEYDERKEEEAYQGLADYTINKSLGVTVAMPKGSGHTFLANYIASLHPTLLIYGKMDHYRKITDLFPLHQDTESLSLYEIFFALYKPGTHQPSPELVEIRKKFENKNAVVLDNSLSIPDDIKNFIYDSSRGMVIMLGH